MKAMAFDLQTKCRVLYQILFTNVPICGSILNESFYILSFFVFTHIIFLFARLDENIFIFTQSHMCLHSTLSPVQEH